MDKITLTNHIRDIDLKNKMFKVIDKAYSCMKNYDVKYTDFLNPYEVKNAISILNNFNDIKYTVDGGFNEAERKLICIYPYYMDYEDIEESIKVVPIPGACAMINALITSGISTKEFIFLGFLPLNKKSRKEKLEEIKNANKTIILYEAPHKLKSTLNDLSLILEDRSVVLARELTKIHEEYIRGTVKELMEKTDNLKGEMILIIEKNNKDNKEELNSLNNLTLEEHYNFYEKNGLNKKEIIKKIAKDRNVSKNEIYQYFI